MKHIVCFLPLLALTFVSAACVTNVYQGSKGDMDTLADYVFSQDTSSIRLFVDQHGISVLDSVDEDGNNLLILAVMENRYESVVALLGSGADPNFLNSKEGTTPLLAASRPYGTQEEWIEMADIVGVLIEYGADPNIYVGDELLMSYPLKASIVWSDNISHILIDAGANPILITNGSSALSVAMMSGNVNMILSIICKYDIDGDTVLSLSLEGESRRSGDILRDLETAGKFPAVTDLMAEYFRDAQAVCQRQ